MASLRIGARSLRPHGDAKESPMKNDLSGLRGKRIAVLAADGFEYVELLVPVKALRAAGARVDVISLHGGRIRGMNLTEPTGTVKVDRTLSDAMPDEYDGLFIPGGFIGPDLLRQSGDAREFVRAFDVANKPIATLCHGPWLLASAELVAGRHLAAWPGVRDDIVHADGVWHDAPLVRDRNWVSSRGPQDMLTFVPAMLGLMASGAASGVEIETAPEGAPVNGLSSPKYECPLGLAVKAARYLPGPTFRTAATLALGLGAAVFAFRRALH
jgi:protease I